MCNCTPLLNFALEHAIKKAQKTNLGLDTNLKEPHIYASGHVSTHPAFKSAFTERGKYLRLRTPDFDARLQNLEYDPENRSQAGEGV